MPSPAWSSSHGVSIAVRNTQCLWYFHSALAFKMYRDRWGSGMAKNKTKKADMHYLEQTDLIIDPEGAIKLMDYRLSISGI